MKFDKFANDYRLLHTKCVKKTSGADSNYFTEYKIRELFERNYISNSSKILDMGCGDGNSARFFSIYFSECEYYGTDISAESIAVAKRKNVALQKRFCCYDGKKLPYDNNFFDVVYIACVLHHVEFNKRKQLLRECLRVLKPMGKLIIFEHNPYNPITRMLVKDCPFDKDAELITPRYQVKLLKHIGFYIDSKAFTLFMPRKGLFKKLQWIEKHISWLPIGGQYYTVSEKKGDKL